MENSDSNSHISYTKRFPQDEIAMLVNKPVEEVLEALRECPDIVALRAVYELIMHKQDDKAHEILQDKKIQTKILNVDLKEKGIKDDIVFSVVIVSFIQEYAIEIILE